MARRSDQDKFDRFTELVARVLGVPIVSLSLVGPRHGVVTSSSGLPAPLVLLLAHRFSRHVAASRRPLVIGDARVHPLGANTPAVRDGLVTAYAGPPRSPASGAAPPPAAARRSRTVEVRPPADDIWSAAHSRVAQLVEQPAVNRRVAGSSPASGASQLSAPQSLSDGPFGPSGAG